MIATHRFGFATPAAPDDVWAALTDPERTPRWLNGLALESDWGEGSAVVLRHGPSVAVSGEVVAVVPGRRLSLALDGGFGPATYLTWTVRPGPGGAIVRLVVDDADPDPAEDGRDLEDAWLPVLARLQDVLAGERRAESRG
ncbi:MAG TPA: SRPBCC domain-containing protein [Acidimicrobiales bacterium]|nr:SRPBCC domain-containing protein [Acidimicrobiales bacterium]